MLEYAVVGAGSLYFIIDFFTHYSTDKVIRKFNNIMKATGVKNKNESTYKALKAIKKQYGFDLIISLPDALSYKKLEDKLPEIESGLRCIAQIEWKRFDGCAYLKTAMQEYDENKRFSPVETKGQWELFFGETYFLDKLKSDMRNFPHVLIAGSTGTGKSRCLFIALTNLLYQYNNVDLYLAQISDKKDLKKFAYYQQTKYFAQSLQTADQLIKYLLDMQKERNRQLDKYNMNNIDEYNKRFKDNPMNYAYLVIDEYASLMPGETKAVDANFNIKKRMLYNLNELQRQARSAGLFILSSLQRPDKSNLDPNTKNLYNTKVAFRANNIASSKVLVDDGSVFNLPNREALFIESEHRILKTPFIDDKLIKVLLVEKYVENHKYIDVFPKTNPQNVLPMKKSKGVVRKC